MAKQWIVVPALLLTAVARSAGAQYEELWSWPAPDVFTPAVFCDVGQTRPGAGRSLLYGVNPSQGSFTGLRLLEGTTGEVLWSFDEPPGHYIHIASLTNYASLGTLQVSWKAGPQLLDVDGDGMDEMVFADFPYGTSNPRPATAHVIKYDAPVAAAETPATNPARLGLGQTRPNPTRSLSVIDFELPQSGHVKLMVYNVQGQAVRLLVDEEKLAGSHSVVWDGTDGHRRQVPSGTYFYSVRTVLGEQSRKAVALR